MEGTSKRKLKKSRNSIENAQKFYEAWMEPDWQASSPSPIAPTPIPTLKNRSSFKFHPDYNRDLPSSSLARSPSSLSMPSINSASEFPTPTIPQNFSSKFKPMDFGRFYRWVTNGRLSDLHLVKKLMFDD